MHAMRRFSLLQLIYWWTVGALVLGVVGWINGDPVGTIVISAFVLIGIALGQWRGGWGLAACAVWAAGLCITLAWVTARQLQLVVSPHLHSDSDVIVFFGMWALFVGAPTVGAAALAGWVHRRFIRRESSE